MKYRLKILSIIFTLSLLMIACSSENNENSNNTSETNTVSDNYESSTNNEADNNSETDLEKPNESYKESNAEDEDIDNKETDKEDQPKDKLTDLDISELEIDKKINIKSDFDVYINASDAESKTNPLVKYQKGTYFIFKISDKAINLTRTEDSAGGWVNYEDLGLDKSKLKDTQFANINTSSNNNSTDSNSNNDNNLSTEAQSWSWGYPDSSEEFRKLGGLYKKDSPNTIYLTFDNGYEYKNNSTEILDILKKNDVKVAFFVTGHFISENTDIVRRMLKEGHNVSNHTQNHLHQGEISPDEVKKDITTWEKTYERELGQKPTSSLMRPPAGSFSKASVKLAKDLGYNSVFWAFAYNDWDPKNQPDVKKSLEQLLNRNDDGNILLLHSVSTTNVKLLDEYIKKTKEAGYSFELLK